MQLAEVAQQNAVTCIQAELNGMVQLQGHVRAAVFLQRDGASAPSNSVGDNLPVQHDGPSEGA